MTAPHADADLLVALGAFAGAQVLVVCLSVIIANAYRERALLLHAGATMMGLLAVQNLVGGHPFVAGSAVLLVLALSGLQLHDLVSDGGASRAPRRWLVGISVGLLPALAIVGPWRHWQLLLPGIAVWSAVLVVLMIRAWPQSRPWGWWLLAGQLALAGGAGWLGWRSLDEQPDPPLPLAALLTLWCAAVFLATAWRNRILGETRVRIDARNTVDPLTGEENWVGEAALGPSVLTTSFDRNERDRRERDLIEKALAATGGNKAEAARALGLARSTLVSRLKKYGMNGS